MPENANLGTDHGTANLMFLAGKPVPGGHYGKVPSLTGLEGTAQGRVRAVPGVRVVDAGVHSTTERPQAGPFAFRGERSGADQRGTATRSQTDSRSCVRLVVIRYEKRASNV